VHYGMAQPVNNVQLDHSTITVFALQSIPFVIHGIAITDSALHVTMDMFLMEIPVLLITKTLTTILFAKLGTEPTALNALQEPTFKEQFVLLLTKTVILGTLKMDNVLPVTMVSLYKEEHVFNYLLQLVLAKTPIFIALEQILEDFVSVVSTDSLYKTEPVLQISKTLHVAEIHLSAKIDQYCQYYYINISLFNHLFKSLISFFFLFSFSLFHLIFS
jgi:hypothetical protein